MKLSGFFSRAVIGISLSTSLAAGVFAASAQNGKPILSSAPSKPAPARWSSNTTIITNSTALEESSQGLGDLPLLPAPPDTRLDASKRTLGARNVSARGMDRRVKLPSKLAEEYGRANAMEWSVRAQPISVQAQDRLRMRGKRALDEKPFMRGKVRNKEQTIKRGRHP